MASARQSQPRATSAGGRGRSGSGGVASQKCVGYVDVHIYCRRQVVVLLTAGVDDGGSAAAVVVTETS
jgi:hypothetical protein